MSWDEIDPQITDRIQMYARNPMLQHVVQVMKDDNEIKINITDTHTHTILPALPKEFEQLYSFIDADTSVTVSNDWSILTCNDVHWRYDYYVSKGQRRIVPLAMQYIGMGHVIMLAYNPSDQFMFTYFDGGSNGYDRMINEAEALKLTPEQMHRVDLETVFSGPNNFL